MSVELSVVIPCLDEEKTIGVCVGTALKAFSEMGTTGEVLVVDNGSTDQSFKRAQEAGATVIFHDVKGYGSAIKKGIEHAKGEFIIMGDGDDTYDFSDIKKFVHLLREGADLVMGNRLNRNLHPKAMPRLHRWVGTPILTWHLNLFFGTHFSDINCGLRGFRKSAIDKLSLKCGGMEFASEMLVKARQKKLLMKETSISYRPASYDRNSHLHSFRDGWRHLRFMLVFCPKYLFLFPGITLFLIGLFLTLLLHFKTVFVFGMPLGISSATLVSALLFMGLQIALFGVYSIVLNHSRGLMEEDGITHFFKKHFTLERGLLTGTIFSFAGATMFAWTMIRIFNVANNLPYVDVPLARFAIMSIFIALLGLQIIFSSFYLSLFNLTETLK